MEEDLVERVKCIQRTDPEGKLKWMSYTYASGNNKHDPRAYDAAFLEEFFHQLDADAIEIDPWLKERNNPNELFVGRLPKDIEEYEISAYFSEWGEIENLNLKEGKGFAFVTFKDSSVIDLIVNSSDKHMIRDDWVDCRRSSTKGKGGKGSKGGKSKGGKRGDSGKGKGGDSGKGKGGDSGKGKGGKDGGKGKGKGKSRPY